MPIEGATSHYQVDPQHPEAAKFTGTFNGELLNKEKQGFTAHLAPGFREPEGNVSHRFSKEGQGDIVVAGLSREGWTEVTRVFDSMKPDATRGEIEDAIIQQLPWLTWPKEYTGR